MIRRKGKSVGLDAMVRFFMQKYDIPTKRDLEKIYARLDRLEALISSGKLSSSRKPKSSGRRMDGTSAGDRVLKAIEGSKKGMNFAGIQAKTGYPEKKIRNIIFRLNKLSRIKRQSRGLYIAS